jgi:hypothetical protein
MTSESKILTVSYGTFSCTLEGFDNPFDTMKAIAEYFRDLAAQDRHFGAEPPPPDAAMLHRLAEREVSRLAAASKHEDAARLQVPDDAVAADAPIAPRIQINPVNRRAAHTPVEADASVEEEPTTPEPSLQDVIPDGVAAKLARIRRAVHPVADMAAPLAAFAVDPEVAGSDDLAAEGPATESAQDDDDGIAAEAAEFATEGAVLAEPTLAEASETVAARLGALISSDAGAAQSFDEEEAEAVPVAADWSADDTADAAFDDGIEATPLLADAEVAAEIAPDDDAELEYPSAFVAEPDDEPSDEDLALLAELDGIALDEAGPTAALDDALPEDRPVDLSLAEAVVEDPVPETLTVTVEDAVAPDPVPEAPAPVDEEAEEVAVFDVPAEAPAANAEEPALPQSKAGARARRVNSRVVRIHPGDDAIDTAGDGATRVLASTEEADEIARLMQQADEVMAEDENRRRQEALSRLKAAVAATEADRADIDYEAPKANVNLDPYRDDLAEAIQPDAPVEPPAAPEVKPRRKSVTIRPTEPRPGTIRPGMISPPPLVLVSEQRIDRIVPPAAPPTPAAPSMAPVAPGITPSAPEAQPMVALRTGRLSGAIGAGAAVAASSVPGHNIVLEKPSYGPASEADDDEELAEDSKEIDESGLAAFAETVGAKSMAEMLEAAAAYATCVENRSQFTRPQLMRRMMASAGGKPVSREDGLRSFGTLLRTGRIEKVTRGHYSLADNSPYLAEARRLN